MPITRNSIYWDGCFWPNELYAVCFYWSFMTLTTIGYGDVVAINRSEHLFVCMTMCIGSCVWAFIMGSICAAASNINPAKAEFQLHMDNLNAFMRRHAIAGAAQVRYRSYFIQKRATCEQATAQRLLALMSPKLAGEIVEQTQPVLFNGSISFMRGARIDFVVEVVCAMRTRTLGPAETPQRARPGGGVLAAQDVARRQAGRAPRVRRGLRGRARRVAAERARPPRSRPGDGQAAGPAMHVVVLRGRPLVLQGPGRAVPDARARRAR